MEIRDKIEGDYIVNEITNVYGLIVGKVTVENRLILNGTINGDVFLTRNGSASIYGAVNGNIINKGKCHIYGKVNGNIYSHPLDIKIDGKASIIGRINLMDVIRTDGIHPSDLEDQNHIILRNDIERRIIKNSQANIQTRIDVYSTSGSSDPTVYECIYKNTPIKSILDLEFKIIKI